MKQHLNTLFVLTQGAYLKKDGESIVVRIEKKDRLWLPMINVGAVVCFGRVSCSPYLLGACAQKGIAISFMTEHGRFLAAVNGFTPGNVLLRREQYRRADDPVATAAIARACIIGKLANFRTVLRSRRPPLDNVNAMLSFLYSMLTNDMRSACESAGLDAAVGFLHRDRSGRPGLALDLMEELRPVLADRVVLSLINRQQVKSNGFVEEPGGGIRTDETTRKELVGAYQKRKQEEITHPFLQEKMTLGLVPLIQARLMARFLRGDSDAYPPFSWK